MSATAPQDHPKTASRSPLTAVLLAIIAVLVLVIGFLVADRASLQAQLRQGQSSAQSSPDGTGASDSAAITPTTDENVLGLIREQIRRDESDRQAKGDAAAKVVMVLYSDFSCPVCTYFAQSIEPELADLVEDGTLRIEWRDLAQITQTSPLAAQAGIAAAQQGRFWQFHDAVYAAAQPNDHPEYTQDLLISYAREAGVPDIEAFTATMNDQATADKVAADKEYAYSIGIKGTPFMIIGDSVMSGLTENAVDTIRATIAEQALNPDAA